MARPAAPARLSATSSDRDLASTSTKLASGKWYASGKVWCPPPHPKSTTFAVGLRLSSGATKRNTFTSCSRFLAPLARGTPPPSGCVTSSCGGRLFQSLSAVASRAHRLASSRVSSSSHGSQMSPSAVSTSSSPAVTSGLVEYDGHRAGAPLSN